MNPSEGLQTALNQIRETLVADNKVYQEQIPLVEHYTSSQVYGQSLLALPSDLRNKFIQSLVNRIAYTKFQMDYFENPLRELANDELPLGAIGQDIYVNPARGRVYNIDDFAGLLAKYESDVKVEYNELNFDVQYPVTIIRKELEKAFTSWGDFENFLMGISQSLYNGAYIDMFRYTKNIISGAYKENRGVIQTISAVSSADTAKAFVEKARELYLNFQLPSTEYNAWAKNGGAGRPIITWTRPEDIVMIVRNDIRAKLDVEVLASAFNIDKTTLLGNIITVDNFDAYDDDGTKVFNGSAIVGMIADKAWFKIKTQDMYMESFINPNNRTIQYYLNIIRMYNMSLFANGVIFATAQPSVAATELKFIETAPEVTAGKSVVLHVESTPFTANPTLSYSSSSTSYATVGSETGKSITVTGVAAGTPTITVSDGTHRATVTLKVNAAS